MGSPMRTSAVGSSPDSNGEARAIALVGLACRFPGAPDAAALWQLLIEERDAVHEVPAGRWSPSAVGGRVCRAALLDQVDGFDARFFGVSPREAVQMDPQQRLLLE